MQNLMDMRCIHPTKGSRQLRSRNTRGQHRLMIYVKRDIGAGFTARGENAIMIVVYEQSLLASVGVIA